jgi:SAM-dependent methyltransferase
MDNATGKRLLAQIRGADYAHPGEEEANRLLFAGLAPDPRRRVLDAGCGGAGTAAWVQAHGYGAVTGIEIDAATAALARERHPEVTIAQGDLQRAGEALAGPFDLIYSMTAMYAVADQAATFRELGALAAPGAQLRLLEYADPHGHFAAANDGDPSRGWWRPLRPREMPHLLAAAGWSHAEVRDLQPEFVLWYRRLCERIVGGRRATTAEFGRDWYDFVAREYAEILSQVRRGRLGGVLVRARRR